MRIPEVIANVLELARWAPSGDNTQPWRFEVVDDSHFVVHGFDTRDHCVYDLDGHSSQLAVGALLETISLAATSQGRHALISRRPDTPETHLLFDVRLEPALAVESHPLVGSIEKRSVQRRAMSTQPLTQEQKATLSRALSNAHEIAWFEGTGARYDMAKLCFDNAKIRLTIPEAYEVHRSIIDWHTRYSEDRIPDQAVGADTLNLKIMHWAMASWERIDFLNTWLLGHLMPRVQMDLVPGILCAGHFTLVAPRPVRTVDDYIEAGRVMQRFWLTATSLGLHIQPEMTPLIFARYHRQGVGFTRIASATTKAAELNSRLVNLLDGRDVDSVFFLGRIGMGPAPFARSTRKPLHSLLVTEA